MNFKFECPHCEQRVSVEEDQAGISAACPTCENEIVVPVPIALGERPVSAPSSFPLKGLRGSGVWAAAGLLASVLALGGVLVLHEHLRYAPVPKHEKRPTIAQAAPAIPATSASVTSPTAEAPAQNHLEPEQLLDRYFACKTWRERLPFVRNPDQVEPPMAQYYKSRELQQGIERKYDLRRELYGSLIIPVRMKLPGRADETKYYWFTKNGDDFQIDWEASTAWNPISWAAYRSDRPTEPYRFRCEIELADFFSFEFSDRTEWIAVWLRGSGGLIGYARRGSKTSEALRDLLADGNSKFAVVDIRFPNSRGTGTSVEIVRLVTSGWVLQDEAKASLGSSTVAVAQSPSANLPSPMGEGGASRIESAVKDRINPKNGMEAFADVSGISFDGIKDLPPLEQPKAMAVASLRMAAWMLGMGSLSEAEKAAPNGLPGDDSKRAVIAELMWKTLGEPVFLRDSQKFAQYISLDDQMELAHCEFKRGFSDGLAMKDPLK